MKKVLSESYCNNLIESNIKGEWERVDRFGKYYQKFIFDLELEHNLEVFFGRKFNSRPIVKIIKLTEGDFIPLFSADYSRQVDSYFSRYKNTNFIIHTFLNSNYIGGELVFKTNVFSAKSGFGLVQSKTDKCKINLLQEGTSFMLLCFIEELEKLSVI